MDADGLLANTRLHWENALLGVQIKAKPANGKGGAGESGIVAGVTSSSEKGELPPEAGGREGAVQQIQVRALTPSVVINIVVWSPYCWKCTKTVLILIFVKGPASLRRS
jgi:hypothetical protein